MPLRSVANSHALPFPEYVARATINLGVDLDRAVLTSPDVEKVGLLIPSLFSKIDCSTNVNNFSNRSKTT
jgi:hypothetical protein